MTTIEVESYKRWVFHHNPSSSFLRSSACCEYIYIYILCHGGAEETSGRSSPCEPALTANRLAERNFSPSFHFYFCQLSYPLSTLRVFSIFPSEGCLCFSRPPLICATSAWATLEVNIIIIRGHSVSAGSLFTYYHHRSNTKKLPGLRLVILTPVARAIGPGNRAGLGLATGLRSYMREYLSLNIFHFTARSLICNPQC